MFFYDRYTDPGDLDNSKPGTVDEFGIPYDKRVNGLHT